MKDDLLTNLLKHLDPEPRLVAVDALEVVELRALGYVEERGLRLTPAGQAKLAELRTRFEVYDLQAVEPEALAPADGITVTVLPDLDSMGFPRVTVSGPTREAVVEYVRAQWGEEDEAWFQEYVVDRVELVRP